MPLRSATDLIPIFQRSMVIDFPIEGMKMSSLMDWSLVMAGSMAELLTKGRKTVWVKWEHGHYLEWPEIDISPILGFPKFLLLKIFKEIS